MSGDIGSSGYSAANRCRNCGFVAVGAGAGIAADTGGAIGGATGSIPVSKAGW